MANKYEKKLKIFCYNPGLLFKEINDYFPYALILTSGSLKPFDILEKELGIKFDIILENEHIIKNDQFKFTIINKIIHNGNSYKLKLDLYNRNNDKMIESLGEIIFNLTKTNNKGGILVFFPSYKYLENCYTVWKKYKIDEKIEKYKSIILDSFNKKLLCNDIIKSENKNFIYFLCTEVVHLKELTFLMKMLEW
jgi:Rad3-related DNA helicase